MIRSGISLAALLGSALLLNSCALLLRPNGPNVENPALTELSGLAQSRADPNLLWAHNDSGDSARLFRVGRRGEDLGAVSVPGATAVDWEDIAAFIWHGQPALLIGDVGDNDAVRDHITLYAVRDPGLDGAATLLWQLDIRYPDGPRDCEAVAVDPLDPAVILLSKRDHPQHLYRVALPQRPPPSGTPIVAEALGPVTTLPRATLADLVGNPLYERFDGPTALDIAPSGRFAVVTTYKDAYWYRRGPGQDWAAVFAAAPVTIHLPHLQQLEAGAIEGDEQSLWISGEGRHPPLARVALPAP